MLSSNDIEAMVRITFAAADRGRRLVDDAADQPVDLGVEIRLRHDMIKQSRRETAFASKGSTRLWRGGLRVRQRTATPMTASARSASQYANAIATI